MRSIVLWLVEKEVKHNLISEAEKRLYEYGYTIFFNTVINLFVIMLIAILCNALEYIVFFSVMFIPLRSYAGGWHADKVWKCILLTNFTIFLLILIQENIIVNNPIAMIIGGGICASYIFYVSPVQNKYRILNLPEKKRYKRNSRIILTIQFISFMVLIIFHNYFIAQIILYELVIIAISLFVEKMDEYILIED